MIEPVLVLECEERSGATPRRRAYHLFDLQTLVQIRIVKELRDAGVSLQRIRYAIGQLRSRHGQSWQQAWIVTDGIQIYEQTDDPSVVESLARSERGQLAFSVIALGATVRSTQARLEKCRPFPLDRFSLEE